MMPRAGSGAGETNEAFRYASLELDPEKEFEHAKWIVLTTAQPYLDDDQVDTKTKPGQGVHSSERSGLMSGNPLAHQNNLPSGMIAP